jgi:hypothetical protein
LICQAQWNRVRLDVPAPQIIRPAHYANISACKVFAEEELALGFGKPV